MKSIIAITFLALAAIGCHAQIPPTPSPTAQVTWTASTSCTTSTPCSAYVISRAPCTTSACPATTGTTYVQVGTVSGTTTTFTDSSLSSGQFGWIVQAQQGTPTETSQPSGISNGGVPLVVTGPPNAPTAPTVTTTAELVKPEVRPDGDQQVAQVAMVGNVRVRMLR